MKTPLDVLRGYAPHDYTLNGVLNSRCAQRGEAPMILDESGHGLTWNQGAQAINALARAFAERGVQPGERVAIVARNSPAHVLLLFALARLGAIMVPINPELGVAELSYALKHAQVSGVVLDEGVRSTVDQALEESGVQAWRVLAEGVSANGLPSLQEWQDKSADIALPAVPSADSPCLMIFTSGTTGYPKGVLHSQRSILLVGEANLGRMRLQPEDKILIVLPFFHVNALCYSVCGMIAAGCALVVTPRFSASRFWQIVVDSGATVVNFIEAMGNILKSRDRSEFRKDHRIRVAYGIRQSSYKAFQEEFGIANLLSGFGMSEVPGVTCNPYGEPGKPGSMGVLAQHPDPEQPWAQCRIVDEKGDDVEADVVGELWVRTPVCMLGYYNDPEQTAAAFQDGWFRTGDMVRRDAEGWFFYVSRAKDIIRRRGENIAGAELDRVVGEHPAVYEAAAIAVPSELGEDDILVAAVLHPGTSLEAEGLAQWCRERLAAHKVPRYVVFVDSIPHTATHKIAKSLMRQDATLRERATDLQRG
ncbi:AMP-binding protein [Ottowia thiooxydans]|uniref:AMP-binding protein n=1 Tax=Ottowia thiooxydans TaxID=219182 RepID=UPI00040E51A9|nr:AMP-binding protein [Ottowia thiooxydans]